VCIICCTCYAPGSVPHTSLDVRDSMLLIQLCGHTEVRTPEASRSRAPIRKCYMPHFASNSLVEMDACKFISMDRHNCREQKCACGTPASMLQRHTCT